MRYNRPRHSSLSVVSTAQLLLGCNRIGYYVVEQTWGTRFGHNAEYVRRAQGSESDHCSSRPATRHQSATSSNRNTSSPTIRSCSSPSTLRRRCARYICDTWQASRCRPCKTPEIVSCASVDRYLNQNRHCPSCKKLEFKTASVWWTRIWHG